MKAPKKLYFDDIPIYGFVEVISIYSLFAAEAI